MTVSEAVGEVTDADFEAEVVQADRLVLVDMWAPWCGPCRMVEPVLEELAEANGDRVKICRLNVDENLQTAAEYGISAIPTVILFADGKEADRLIGVQTKQAYQAAVDKAADR